MKMVNYFAALEVSESIGEINGAGSQTCSSLLVKMSNALLRHL